jgi:hypothetical protein
MNEDVTARSDSLLESVDSFCKDHLSEKDRNKVLALVDQMYKSCPALFNSGKLEVWAAALINCAINRLRLVSYIKVTASALSRFYAVSSDLINKKSRLLFTIHTSARYTLPAHMTLEISIQIGLQPQHINQSPQI